MKRHGKMAKGKDKPRPARPSWYARACLTFGVFGFIPLVAPVAVVVGVIGLYRVITKREGPRDLAYIIVGLVAAAAWICLYVTWVLPQIHFAKHDADWI